MAAQPDVIVDIVKTCVGWIGAIVAAVFAAFWALFQWVYGARLDAKDNEIERLEKKIEDLKSQLSTPTDALVQVQLYKTVADKEMARLSAELEEARRVGDVKLQEEKGRRLKEQQELNRTIAELQKQLETYKGNVETLQADVEENVTRTISKSPTLIEILGSVGSGPSGTTVITPPRPAVANSNINRLLQMIRQRQQKKDNNPSENN